MYVQTFVLKAKKYVNTHLVSRVVTDLMLCTFASLHIKKSYHVDHDLCTPKEYHQRIALKYMASASFKTIVVA